VWTSSRFGNETLRKYDENGNLLFSSPGYANVGVRGIALVPADGSVWVLSSGWFSAPAHLDHLDASGNVLLHIPAEDIEPDRPFGLRFVAVGPSKGIRQQIEAMIDEILEDLDLHGGAAASLTSKLENVLAKLDKDNVGAAINQLQAFIQETQALVRADKLTQSEADALIAAAQDVIDRLSA
jgi:hypothetical protein